jgi:hypothetical protein
LVGFHTTIDAFSLLSVVACQLLVVLRTLSFAIVECFFSLCKETTLFSGGTLSIKFELNLTFRMLSCLLVESERRDLDLSLNKQRKIFQRR